jgi:PPP family 3-phenylpropionic acid transporter
VSSGRSIESGERSNGCLVLTVSAAALIEASHGFNSIAMVTWSARGYGPALSGALWATGILADVVFLWFMGSIRSRIGPTRLLTLGGMGALARWNGFALSPPLPVLFGLQILHALSFTATYLASVQLVHRLARDQRGLAAQAMNWALSSGLCAGLGTLGAGPLYAALGVHGYWVMCAVAGVGLVLALVLERFMQPRWHPGHVALESTQRHATFRIAVRAQPSASR